MGRIVVSEFVTLDGVFEDPGGSEGLDRGGWAFKFDRGPEGDKFKLDELLSADALLLGRKTYEGFAAAWPARTDDVGFADKMNSMRKYLVSSTLAEPSWNNTAVIAGDVPAELARIRAEPGAEVLVAGSGQLVTTLVAHRLVDELRLMVFPVLLGSGRKLFAGGFEPSGLEVTDARTSAEVVLLTLRPKGDEAT